MLRDLEKGGVETLAVDRCPRCSTFTVISTSSVKTADDLVVLWCITKATDLSRLELYVTYARELARTGDFARAKSVALETVGHVTWEDPSIHFLLGELGVVSREPALAREAMRCLRYLKHEGWEEKLHEVVKSGSARFEVPV